ncbi:MAG: Glu/Leu/Phe/Val family dehydrogenase, partial [Candidatus Acidiferrales bacterium]
AGGIAARLFDEAGAKIIAVSDSKGGIVNPRGLDPLKALKFKEKSGSVVGLAGTSRVSNQELLELKCDILIPAALENVITSENAARVKARIISEAANGPVTPMADDILTRNNVFLLPDILANAGGVTVSYFEWVQDLQNFFWEEDQVNAKLEAMMKRAFQEVHETSKRYKVNMRIAAYILAIGRVADATLVRGLFP